MNVPADRGLIARLRADLTRAIRTRDQAAIAALRSALAAIDNAAAVEATATAGSSASSPIAGALNGLGSTEVPRRALDTGELQTLILAEIANRQDAAAEYDRAGREDEAARLRDEAAMLQTYIAEP